MRMLKRLRKESGYTLVELVVVVLIVGILAAYGVPQYLRTVETSKADDIVSLVNMVGTTNKMFALDHGNVYVTGQFTAGCGPGTCPTGAGPFTNACALVWCKYLADQNFAVKAYDVYACDGNTSSSCATLGSGNFTAGARRKTGASSPYDTWGFTMNTSGVITAYGTTPPTPTY